MKKSSLYQVVITAIVVVFSSLALQAQPKMTCETRYVIKTASDLYKLGDLQSANWKQFILSQPMYSHGSSYTLSFLAKKNADFNASTFAEKGIIIGSQIGDILTLRVPMDALADISHMPGLAYLEIAGKVDPDLDKVVFDTRVDSIHAGINLPQAYTGQNVIIGITDWGFDYTSPMFYDTSLIQTRIIAAWDHYKKAGPPPAGYTYGAEYTTPATLLAAQCDTANQYDFGTHGTHVAGIAGGSGAGTPYRGMAFESEYLMVTILSDEAAILDAFNWMKAKADAAGKRLVMNMSWGSYRRPLDGNSMVSQAIDNLSSQGVIFCNSAGNNGNVNFHIRHSFAADTLKSQIAFYTYTDTTMWGEGIPMWGEINHSFKAGIRLLNASNQIVAETPLFHTSVDTNFIDSILIVGVDTIFYNMNADAVHPLNQLPYMMLKVKNKTSYKTVLVSYADSGVVHYWNVMERKTGLGNWGQNFLTLGAGYTAGDRDYGVSEPAVTTSLITVAAHYAEYLNGVGNIVGGNVATFSSFGPRMDGTMKPDISAPGANVCSSISSFTTAAYTTATTITFNTRIYPFARFSGTSMSSPATAGVCALILEANPLLTPQEIKDIIILTAREDSKTGDVPDSGSTRWGHGKLNAYYAIAMALNIVNINTYAQHGLVVFPNPSQDQLFLLSDKDENDIFSLGIYSLEGKLLSSCTYQWNTAIDISTLPNGIYVLRLSGDTENYQCKFVKTGR